MPGMAMRGVAVTRVVGGVVARMVMVMAARLRRCIRRMVNARRGTSLAVHPTGIAVLVVLFLPNRDSMFDFVDDVSACGEGFGAVACAYAYPHCHFTDREVADAVYAGSVFDTKSGNRFGDDAIIAREHDDANAMSFEISKRVGR